MRSLTKLNGVLSLKVKALSPSVSMVSMNFSIGWYTLPSTIMRSNDVFTSLAVTELPSENLAPSRMATLYSVSEIFSGSPLAKPEVKLPVDISRVYKASVTCQLPLIGRAIDVDNGLKSRLEYATCAVMVSFTTVPDAEVPPDEPQPANAINPATVAATATLNILRFMVTPLPRVCCEPVLRRQTFAARTVGHSPARLLRHGWLSDVRTIKII